MAAGVHGANPGLQQKLLDDQYTQRQRELDRKRETAPQGTWVGPNSANANTMEQAREGQRFVDAAGHDRDCSGIRQLVGLLTPMGLAFLPCAVNRLFRWHVSHMEEPHKSSFCCLSKTPGAEYYSSAGCADAGGGYETIGYNDSQSRGNGFSRHTLDKINVVASTAWIITFSALAIVNYS